MESRAVATGAVDHQQDDKQQDHDEVMIPNTFTQPGVPVFDLWLVPTLVSSPESG